MGLPEHLVIPEWTTWERGWPVVRWDDDGIPHGVDLTGYTLKAQVRPYTESSTVFYEWTLDAGNARIDSRDVSVWDLYSRTKYTVATGLLVLHVDPEVSGAWPWRKGVWDMKTYGPQPTPWVDPIAGGTIEKTLAVTRP